MGEKNPMTEKVHISTRQGVKQLEAFSENPAGNPIQLNELGSVANWRLREENTFTLLEENTSGKTKPQIRTELACAHILVLSPRPSHFLGYIFMNPHQFYSGFGLETYGI